MAFLSAFILGLSGGFGHCISMCHPFVLYISSRYPATGYNILLPQIKYNLGRTVTYSFMGFIIGFLGNMEILNTAFRPVITIIAGAFLVLMALYTVFGKHIPIPASFSARFQRFLSIRSPFITGLALGFLPCGMVMGALATSATASGPLTGALTMALFGIGTSFALLLLALFGGLILRYISVARWVFMVIIFVTGCIFIVKGITRLLPA